LSLELHLRWLGQPSEVVFDEVHFGKFITGYGTGEYFFDVHPPLGKLMIAGIAGLAGVSPSHAFYRGGAPYLNNSYLWLRLWPGLFGSLLVPLIYLLTLRISRSRVAAAFAGLFVLLDNALLVESKFILLDVFLLLFGFLAIYLFWQSKLFFRDGKWRWWAACGSAIAAGLCVSIKWTGLGFWGLLLLFSSAILARQILKRETGRVQIIFVTLMLVVVPLVLYVAFFYIHFALLPNPGPGNHLMTSRFASSQANGFPVRDFAANLWELHRKMLSVHVSMFDHPYGSVWCTWPLMIRPLLYWQGSVAVGHGSVTPARIYLLGNPIIWVICTLLTAIFLLSFTFRITTKGLRLWLTWPSLGTNASRKENHGNTDVFLAIGYLVNWLPFAFISRVMFLYHYLTALIFSIIIASIMLARLRRGRNSIRAGATVLAFAGFLIVSPLTFGLPLNVQPLWVAEITTLISNKLIFHPSSKTCFHCVSQ